MLFHHHHFTYDIMTQNTVRMRDAVGVSCRIARMRKIVGVAFFDSNRCALAMGQNESSFKRDYEQCVSQLSTVQLREITAHFHEVYAKAGGSKGHLVDREAFSKYFKLPVTVGERLFESFDAQKVSRGWNMLTSRAVFINR